MRSYVRQYGIKQGNSVVGETKLHHTVEATYVWRNEAYRSNAAYITGPDHKLDLLLSSLVIADFDIADLFLTAVDVKV